MPKTKLVFFKDLDGSIPALDWLDEQSSKVKAKCQERLIRLQDMGHELRRPEADLLRDGIHELRIGFQGVNYRLLYFFHGKIAAVVSHGLTKERAVPVREIELAIRRKRQFEQDPNKHSNEE